MLDNNHFTQELILSQEIILHENTGIQNLEEGISTKFQKTVKNLTEQTFIETRTNRAGIIGKGDSCVILITKIYTVRTNF